MTTGDYCARVSEDLIAVVGLDAADIEEAAQRVTDYLTGSRVIKPNAHRDELWAPSQWVADDGADAVLAEAQDSGWRDLANNGVDIAVEGRLHDAGEAYTPPACPSCQTMLDEDQHTHLLDSWVNGREPVVTCARCHSSAPLGDWRSDWPSVVGAPAIVFNNWPPLREGFVEELRRLIGGRTAVVQAHF